MNVMHIATVVCCPCKVPPLDTIRQDNLGNETFNEIKASLENLWQGTILLSDFFPTPTEVSGWSWSNRLRGEWYSFNYLSINQSINQIQFC